jgi:hypothetical protein
MSISSASTVDRGVSGLLGLWIGRIIVGLVLVIVAGVVFFVVKGANIEASGYVGPLVSLFVAALFALAPLLACFVQTTSLDRRSKKLDGVIIAKSGRLNTFRLRRRRWRRFNRRRCPSPILLFRCCCLQ